MAEGAAHLLSLSHALLATGGWRDEREGTQLRVSKLNLETGRIASGVPGKLALSGHVEGPQPKVNLDVALATGYRVDFETLATALSGLDLKASGDAPGFAGFEATAKGDVALDPDATVLWALGEDAKAAKAPKDTKAKEPAAKHKARRRKAKDAEAE